jgi:hypothetical protein
MLQQIKSLDGSYNKTVINKKTISGTITKMKTTSWDGYFFIKNGSCNKKVDVTIK